MYQEFFRQLALGPATINSIDFIMVNNIPFTVILYVLAVFCAVAFVLIRKKIDSAAFKKSLIASFICAAFIFGARTDLDWLLILNQDIPRTKARNVAETLDFVPRTNFYQFIVFAKQNIPEGAAVRPLIDTADDLYNGLPDLARYYFLPAESRADASYIWTYDSRAVYDSVKKSITLGGQTISPVRRVASLAPGADVYQVIAEGTK